MSADKDRHGDGQDGRPTGLSSTLAARFAAAAATTTASGRSPRATVAAATTGKRPLALIRTWYVRTYVGPRRWCLPLEAGRTPRSFLGILIYTPSARLTPIVPFHPG